MGMVVEVPAGYLAAERSFAGSWPVVHLIVERWILSDRYLEVVDPLELAATPLE